MVLFSVYYLSNEVFVNWLIVLLLVELLSVDYYANKVLVNWLVVLFLVELFSVHYYLKSSLFKLVNCPSSDGIVVS